MLYAYMGESSNLLNGRETALSKIIIFSNSIYLVSIGKADKLLIEVAIDY